MNKSIIPNFMYPYWTRFLGIIIIVLGAIIFFQRMYEYNIIDLAGGSFPIAMGLMLIFFSKEKDFDERIAFLKFKSLAISIPIATIITMIINYIENFNGYSIDTDSWFSISAFEYLSITLIVAIICLQYLKLKG
ncbi:hypothetical protein [Echinicola shivajiensis]|uniref:hypothetical protein n=1 Tax=Echinicola shivajiensis TaxID=1035916 RepID=UPI001BFC78C6|nr:hypothetical protein [Echinicola shivajiensis]